MNLSDYVSIISILIAASTLVYSVISNTKKYELTYQYYNDILQWHNMVIEILIYLQLNNVNHDLKMEKLSKLSSLIEQGRFYFPNIDRGDCFGKDKPSAYQGYRNIVLDSLVYLYQIFFKDDYMKYKEHIKRLQRLFTSLVFDYLEPSKQGKQVHKRTMLRRNNEITLEDILNSSPEYIFDLYDNDCDEHKKF